jgi:hypothetical protein
LTLDIEYGRLLNGDLSDLQARWQHGIGLLHQFVEIEFHDGRVVRGILQELTFDSLTLEGSSPLRPETVRRLGPSLQFPCD